GPRPCVVRALWLALMVMGASVPFPASAQASVGVGMQENPVSLQKAAKPGQTWTDICSARCPCSQYRDSGRINQTQSAAHLSWQGPPGAGRLDPIRQFPDPAVPPPGNQGPAPSRRTRDGQNGQLPD